MHAAAASQIHRTSGKPYLFDEVFFSNNRITTSVYHILHTATDFSKTFPVSSLCGAQEMMYNHTKYSQKGKVNINMNFREKLFLLDGAMGTMLQRAGMRSDQDQNDYHMIVLRPWAPQPLWAAACDSCSCSPPAWPSRWGPAWAPGRGP